MSAYIKTFTGKKINLIDPQPEEIDIEDIATGLSFACRFAGQLGYMYPVSWHSLRVSLYVDPEHALAGLLHDASEAYMCDIPSPLKYMLSDYKDYEQQMMEVIADKFGFQFPLHQQVHIVDKWELENMIDKPIDSYDAKKKFLRRYHELI